jgi:hypothetical protein
MRMRIATVTAIFAAALALAPIGTAGTVPVDSTFASTTTTGGLVGSLSEFFTFSGRATVGSVGAVNFAGSYEIFCSQPGVVYPPPCSRKLILTLTSPNGDSLTLAGESDWLNGDPVPPGTWAVDDAASTGRFASSSGSGSYSLDTDDPWAFAGAFAVSGFLSK